MGQVEQFDVKTDVAARIDPGIAAVGEQSYADINFVILDELVQLRADLDPEIGRRVGPYCRRIGFGILVDDVEPPQGEDVDEKPGLAVVLKADRVRPPAHRSQLRDNELLEGDAE